VISVSASGIDSGVSDLGFNGFCCFGGNSFGELAGVGSVPGRGKS